MKQSDEKTTPWIITIPVANEATSRQPRPRGKGEQQPEIYRDLAMALIGSRLDMRKAA